MENISQAFTNIAIYVCYRDKSLNEVFRTSKYAKIIAIKVLDALCYIDNEFIENAKKLAISEHPEKILIILDRMPRIWLARGTCQIAQETIDAFVAIKSGFESFKCFLSENRIKLEETIVNYP